MSPNRQNALQALQQQLQRPAAGGPSARLHHLQELQKQQLTWTAGGEPSVFQQPPREAETAGSKLRLQLLSGRPGRRQPAQLAQSRGGRRSTPQPPQEVLPPPFPAPLPHAQQLTHAPGPSFNPPTSSGAFPYPCPRPTATFDWNSNPFAPDAHLDLEPPHPGLDLSLDPGQLDLQFEFPPCTGLPGGSDSDSWDSAQPWRSASPAAGLPPPQPQRMIEQAPAERWRPDRQRQRQRRQQLQREGEKARVRALLAQPLPLPGAAAAAPARILGEAPPPPPPPPAQPPAFLDQRQASASGTPLPLEARVQLGLCKAKMQQLCEERRYNSSSWELGFEGVLETDLMSVMEWVFGVHQGPLRPLAQAHSGWQGLLAHVAARARSCCADARLSREAKMQELERLHIDLQDAFRLTNCVVELADCGAAVEQLSIPAVRAFRVFEELLEDTDSQLLAHLSAHHHAHWQLAFLRWLGQAELVPPGAARFSEGHLQAVAERLLDLDLLRNHSLQPQMQPYSGSGSRSGGAAPPLRDGSSIEATDSDGGDSEYGGDDDGGGGVAGDDVDDGTFEALARKYGIRWPPAPQQAQTPVSEPGGPLSPDRQEAMREWWALLGPMQGVSLAATGRRCGRGEDGDGDGGRHSEAFLSWADDGRQLLPELQALHADWGACHSACSMAGGAGMQQRTFERMADATLAAVLLSGVGVPLRELSVHTCTTFHRLLGVLQEIDASTCRVAMQPQDERAARVLKWLLRRLAAPGLLKGRTLHLRQVVVEGMAEEFGRGDDGGDDGTAEQPWQQQQQQQYTWWQQQQQKAEEVQRVQQQQQYTWWQQQHPWQQQEPLLRRYSKDSDDDSSGDDAWLRQAPEPATAPGDACSSGAGGGALQPWQVTAAAAGRGAAGTQALPAAANGSHAHFDRRDVTRSEDHLQQQQQQLGVLHPGLQAPARPSALHPALTPPTQAAALSPAAAPSVPSQPAGGGGGGAAKANSLTPASTPTEASAAVLWLVDTLAGSAGPQACGFAAVGAAQMALVALVLQYVRLQQPELMQLLQPMSSPRAAATWLPGGLEQAVFPPPPGVDGVVVLTGYGSTLTHQDLVAAVAGMAANPWKTALSVHGRRNFSVLCREVERRLVAKREGMLLLDARGPEGLEAALLALAKVRDALKPQDRDLCFFIEAINFEHEGVKDPEAAEKRVQDAMRQGGSGMDSLGLPPGSLPSLRLNAAYKAMTGMVYLVTTKSFPFGSAPAADGSPALPEIHLEPEMRQSVVRDFVGEVLQLLRAPANDAAAVAAGSSCAGAGSAMRIKVLAMECELGKPGALVAVQRAGSSGSSSRGKGGGGAATAGAGGAKVSSKRQKARLAQALQQKG